MPSLIIKDYRLITVDILYCLPDHPLILQQFTLQHEDITPLFPRTVKFLEYWDRNIEGKLFQVRVEGVKLFQAQGYRQGIEAGTIH